MVVSCSRWFGFRLDLLSSVFITIVAATAILITENSGEFLHVYYYVVLRVLSILCSLLKEAMPCLLKPLKTVQVNQASQTKLK